MTEKAVIVEVKPDGSIVIRADGFVGPGCVEAVRQYAAALGLEIEGELLPEFYQVEATDALTVGGDTW